MDLLVYKDCLVIEELLELLGNQDHQVTRETREQLGCQEVKDQKVTSEVQDLTDKLVYLDLLDREGLKVHKDNKEIQDHLGLLDKKETQDLQVEQVRTVNQVTQDSLDLQDKQDLKERQVLEPQEA